MADNLERFTQKARHVLRLAEEEAQRFNHNYIGTEHILLGLMGEEAGMVAQVLKELKVDFTLVRQRIVQTAGLGERVPFGKPVLAPRAKKVIELAVQIASQLGHRYIGTEHLLLGLLEEGEGVGVHVLQEFISVDALIQGLTTRLAGGPPVGSEQIAKRLTMLDVIYKQVLTPDDNIFQIGPALNLYTAVRKEMVHQTYAAAIQEERSRLARDLHDSIKQQLFSISVSAAAVRERWTTDPDGAHAALDDIQQSAQAGLVEMNAMLQQLSPTPLAAAGLVEALHEQCQALAFRTGAEVTTALGELPPAEQLPLGTQETIFRITQEALSNVARHARANRVHVRLELASERQTLVLEIQDDGQGFAPAKTPGGMGLTNINERAMRLNGHVAVNSTPGQGTTLRVKIPLLQQTNQ